MANNSIFGSMLKYENCFQIQYILDGFFFSGEEVGPAWNSENKRVSGNRVLAGSRADNNWYLQD